MFRILHSRSLIQNCWISKLSTHVYCEIYSIQSHYPYTLWPLHISPIGYLCLSVSMPAYTTLANRSFMMLASASAVIIPCKAPTNTVLLESSLWDGWRTKLLSLRTHGITWTWQHNKCKIHIWWQTKPLSLRINRSTWTCELNKC